MPSSTGRARRAVLVTALCAAAPLAHAQQLPSIESLSESYVACVQSAFVRRLDDFGASNLPQATERAFLDCQIEEDALYTTAVASAPGNTQALALVRAAVEQLKAKLKAELLAEPPTMPPKEYIARTSAAVMRGCSVLRQPPLHEDRNDQDDI
jgi:hypothetical protein